MNGKVIKFYGAILAFAAAAFCLFYLLYLPNWNYRYVKDHVSLEWPMTPPDAYLGTDPNKYSSFDEAVNSLDLKPEKVWDYDDSIYFIDIAYQREKDNYDVSCYVVEKQGDVFSGPKLKWICGGSDGAANNSYDGHWVDTDIIKGEIIGQLFEYGGSYIDGKGKYNDVVCGLYFGDMILDLSFDVGEFNCEKLGRYDRIGKDVYFWTYEQKDLKSLLESVTTPGHIEAPYGTIDTVEFVYKDIIEALGIHSKPRFQLRLVIYPIVLLVILAALIFTARKAFTVWMSADSKKAFKWLLVIATGVLCFAEVFMILYFIYNPHLTFGDFATNRVFSAILGHNIYDIHCT